jgi:SAM-dependent methyltransferase
MRTLERVGRIARRPGALPDVLVHRVASGSRRRRLLYRYVDWRDRRRARSMSIPVVPPAALRFRVHGELDLDGFLETGKQCSEDLRDALAQLGKDIGSFERVLDFGCGCGRTLRWFEPWSRDSTLHGTDIDEAAIEWCRSSIGFATFAVNSTLPPLAYGDASFDLVYAVSVFTHLSEELQFQWLRELHRIVSPQGYALVTLRGSFYEGDLPPRDLERIRRNGFVFSQMSRHMQGLFPAWYQLATHTEEYVRTRYPEYFEVVRYLPQAMDACQDIAVLRRP